MLVTICTHRSLRLLAACGLSACALPALDTGHDDGTSRGTDDTTMDAPRLATRPLLQREGGLEIPIPAAGVRAQLDVEGVHLAAPDPASAPLTMSFRAWGREHAALREVAAEPSVGACAGMFERGEACVRRAEYAHDGLTEWWLGVDTGVEQGWTVAEQPAGDGALTFVVDIDGGAVDLDGADEARILAESGQAWQVDDVLAWDADGQALHAWFDTDGSALLVKVDDTGARYPLTVDPVYTTAAWTLTGAYDSLTGFSVADAGDVNGDGYGDILVGEPALTGGTGRADLYLGSAGGVASTPAATVTGVGVGYIVSGAGDVDADGYDDVLMGGSTVRLYRGNATGVDSTSVWSNSPGTTDSSNYAAGAGDVNGDGYDDVIVAVYSTRTSTGHADIYLGSASGLASTPATVLTRAGSGFGASVAPAGDVNGDGYDDVLVGAPSIYSAYVFLGSASGVSTTAATTLTNGTYNSKFGFALDTAGDVNGDGYDDVIVGAYNYSSLGKVSLYRGSATGVSSTAATEILGGTTSGGFGMSVAAAGDVNADGFDDVIVGSANGTVRVYHGSSSGLATTGSGSPTSGTASTTYTASNVSAAGDLDGDGYDDVVYGLYAHWTGSGGAVVYRGSSSGVAPASSTYTLLRSADRRSVELSRGGTVVTGDYNRDGYDDVVVGCGDCSSDDGVVYIFSGSASGPDSWTMTTLTGTAGATLRFGSALATGDFDGDGDDDLAIGAPATGSLSSAYVYVYTGNYWYRPVASIAGGARTLFGESLSAGDFDADGYDDLAVGSSEYPYGGLAIVYFGGSSSIGTTTATVSVRGASGDTIGSAVALNGDVNGDGFADLVVGDKDWSSRTGRVLVYRGNTLRTLGTATAVAGTTTSTLMGRSVTLCDVNGDGFSDVVGGASAFGAYMGQVLVWPGSATGMATTAATTLYGTTSSGFGYRVACAGDVEGDGVDELLVGASNDSGFYATSGTSYVYAGSAGGLSSAAIATFDGGLSVAGGDVNRDGLADVLHSSGSTVQLHYGYDTDSDGDGATDSADCADADSTVFPGATELCDGVDNDCDGTIDETAPTWYPDTDGDGFGNRSAGVASCTAPRGYLAEGTDCDDRSAAVNPAALETCDGADDDCDGSVDESDAVDAATWYADSDGDGFGDASAPARACTVPAGHVGDANDCDDRASSVNPAGTERCDGVDDDCDGAVDEDESSDASIWYADVDGDGFGDAATTHRSCAAPAGFLSDARDCDDARAAVFPGAAETCNGTDDDCDGTTDEPDAADARDWYADADGDGFGDLAVRLRACAPASGFVADTTDCDDARADVNPRAVEVCDTADTDENCDGRADDADPAVDATSLTLFWEDADGDGFGDAGDTPVAACDAPAGHADRGEDCDDTRAGVNPDAVERCDPLGLDEDCNGRANDADGGTDDASKTAWHADMDNDGYGDPASTFRSCSAPTGFVGDATDCDDSARGIHPDADEVCDDAGTDEDCDGRMNDADPDVSQDTTSTWYTDADGDGHGDPDAEVRACAQPDDAVEAATDCDDAAASVHPGAVDVADDGVDQDCNGADVVTGDTGTGSGDTATDSGDTDSGDTHAVGSDTGAEEVAAKPSACGCATQGTRPPVWAVAVAGLALARRRRHPRRNTTA